VLGHARFHLSPDIFSIFFYFVSFKSLKERVRRFADKAKFPRLAPGVRWPAEPERIKGRFPHRYGVFKKLIAGFPQLRARFRSEQNTFQSPFVPTVSRDYFPYALKLIHCSDK
jgi:hypothetical protein